MMQDIRRRREGGEQNNAQHMSYVQSTDQAAFFLDNFDFLTILTVFNNFDENMDGGL